ncbi:MAG TPA: carbohydrate kinase family protein [Candidatus Limnocylindrales bacterium]|nr:carbohydrate kinase family protein [Candidatus Limnocylindrales bacterium]
MPPALPARRRSRSAGSRPPRIVVLGDLMVDVVLTPARPLQSGTDVPGRVVMRQGGSAANTARWLARLGARTTLVCAVGRDHEGRELVSALEGDGVRVRATRVAGERTGRIGVLVAPGGERSFVADRAAADGLAPRDLSAAMFQVDLLHLPAYSLLGEPLGLTGRRAIELARAGGALVSLDLSSVGPLLADGRRAAFRLVREAAPDVLFATRVEAEAIVGGRDTTGLGEIARIVVIKHGRSGASVLASATTGRLAFDVATTAIEATDTTGAGDAFDAGFLVAWLSAEAATRRRPAALRRAVLAAHRAAGRQLSTAARELAL